MKFKQSIITSGQFGCFTTIASSYFLKLIMLGHAKAVSQLVSYCCKRRGGGREKSWLIYLSILVPLAALYEFRLLHEQTADWLGRVQTVYISLAMRSGFWLSDYFSKQ